ncbi:MAG: carbohydrate-binding family 9-like protein [Candidatus Latescibacteria bacterium]|nr:carbohydrate-binding family 9-like protein [Candidatus Latescibacterota bacterium]
MRLNVLLLIIVTMLLLSSSLYAETPVYTAMKTGCPMSMDGILDEPAWQKAASVGPFKFQWYESGEKEQTEAKILWDDERIYFAFKCDDKHISAYEYTHFGPVSRDDCCEAFIAPSPDGGERLDYLNYEINCLGTRLLGYHAKSRDLNFYWGDVSGIEIGRVINGTCNNDEDIDDGWVLEFSVPFAHFQDMESRYRGLKRGEKPHDTPQHVDGFKASFPPKDSQVIYVGLHRCGGKTNLQYSQWSPSQTPKPSFHVPEDFGKVVFSTKVLK